VSNKSIINIKTNSYHSHSQLIV